MRINSPMLGMTDFSMIPSYFVDDAQLLHGTSSVNVTGGGLGGAVMLATKPADTQGFGLQYTQGIGSFWTTDEFLRLTYGNDRWQTSTRVVYSSSPNEYSYRNHDKKENIYDDEHNIIGSYYPAKSTTTELSATSTCCGGLLQHGQRRPVRPERLADRLEARGWGA